VGKQLAHVQGLRKVEHSPRGARLTSDVIRPEAAHGDHGQSGQRPPKRPQEVRPGHVGQEPIHENQVDRFASDEFEGLSAAGCQHDGIPVLQDEGEHLPDSRVIFYN
jgi:hypothetical protein